jgi:hypothetical protein
LTHEVENSGDGTASQGDEIQTVTFNAGRGLGGTATLTYNDLYGQSWTTRPFPVGGDNVYRLEIAIVPGGASQDIQFTYNGAKSVAVVLESTATWDALAPDVTTEQIRVAVTQVLDAGITTATTTANGLSLPFAGNDRASAVYVRKHSSATSAKLGGSIHASARITYDIYVPIDMSTHDDNGALLNGLGVIWSSTPTVNTASLSLTNVGDRSDDIANALSSLPNQVIPTVTVSKVDVADSKTISTGANGNAYSQSYSIQFSDPANAGDQNMLQCNAAPCDESGCINRGPGVSETRYMYHSHAIAGQGINFNNQGYFIMDIGDLAAGDAAGTGVLSAGSIKIMWDTGAGIDSAVFAIVSTTAEVQTALRTISGWEAVTVELWGSRKQTDNSDDAAKFLVNHQFKVTFPAGYDDMGKSPTFATMGTADGYAQASPTGTTAQLYDQRFSNSVWIGKTTGYSVLALGSAVAGDFSFNSISPLSSCCAPLNVQVQNGDIWKVTDKRFGAGGLEASDAEVTSSTTKGTVTVEVFQSGGSSNPEDFGAHVIGLTAADAKTNFAYLYEGVTSQQSSDYFAVGSSIEVMGTGKLGATACNNQYRKFKVTGHVTNSFNKEFAKLDSFPADDGTTNTYLNKDYLLKITSNNGTVHNYNDKNVRINVQEVQVIVLGDGASSTTDAVFTLEYKGEGSADLTHASTAAQVAEEINSFSALSGPVSVTGPTANSWTVTFDAKDGDVAQLSILRKAGTDTSLTVHTKHNGWSIEAPLSMGLDTMQAGGIVNVTAKEVCTFTYDSAVTDGYFCYDGVCGILTANALASNNFQTAFDSVKDDNGDQILSGGTVVVASLVVSVTMPMGKSCDGLELRGSTKEITKTVEKHNNGKQFKITRSFLQRSTPATTSATAPAVVFTQEASLLSAVKHVDSVIISDGTGATSGGTQCNAKVAAQGDEGYPIYRTIDGFGATANIFGADGGAGAGAVTAVSATGVLTLTDETLGFLEDEIVRITACSASPSLNGIYRTISDKTVLDTDDTTVQLVHLDGSTPSGLPTDKTDCVFATGLQIGAVANCIVSFGRHVITLDSMPSLSSFATQKSLQYTSPVGSCSVSETTKGTYESYECSNRGACDGKSGLCTCYEGYSGQSCQTQTVLV